MQQGALDHTLTRQVQGAFEVPDVSRVTEGFLDVAVRGLPAEFVHEEESRDQKELAEEGRPGEAVRVPVRGPVAGVHHPVPLC